MPAAAQPGTPFTVAGLSVTAEPWNKEANFLKLEQYTRKAAGMGAAMVVTPEGFLEGYVGNEKRSPGLDRERYFAAGERMEGALMTRVRRLAEELKVHLVVGFAEQRNGKMYNSVVIISPSVGVAGRYSKTHTANDEPFNTQGDELPVFQTALGRLGVLICFDRQMPETARILAVKGAQMILVPAWGSYGEMNDLMMRVRAYENGVHLVFVHPKRCLIIGPRGNIIARNDGEADQIVLARIELSANRPGPINLRKPELYREILGK